MTPASDRALRWDDLVALEPRLNAIADSIANLEPGPHFCATKVWYADFKPELTRLVGYGRGAPDLDPEAGGGRVVPLWDLFDTDAMREGERKQRRIKARDAREGRGPLWSSEAYDLAYDALYALLPACRDCSDCGLPRGRLHG